jgi:hypothetical protein
LDDDNESIISPPTTNINRGYSLTTGCKHKPSIKRETGEREIRRNKVGGESVPSGLGSGSGLTGRKKHKSLPVPPRKSSNGEGSNQKTGTEIIVDTRRYCMVDPFKLGGHRRSYTLDTTWNITAFFDHSGDKKDGEESPATILIAKKENLARNNRFSIQPTRRNSKKRRSIAREIREVEVREVRTFRWESRRNYREKTCSQLYELYEKQHYVDDIREKPLPPIPYNVFQNEKNVNVQPNIIKDSETIIDPELQSIIDTLSLISDHHTIVSSSDGDSIIYTPTSTARESFSDLLITEEMVLEDNSSIRDSIYSFETLPVEVEMCLSCKRRSTDSVYSIQWCKTCGIKRFEEQFGSWSSGNDDIDCFILESQLNSSSFSDHLEWIPFDRLQDIELIGTGEYGYSFQAIWLDGPREGWDMKNDQYVRYGECLVALKCFEVPKNSSDFFDQVNTFFFEYKKIYIIFRDY